jgi:hypothetical protein
VVRGEDGERTLRADALVVAEPLAPAVPPGLDAGAAVRVGDARRPRDIASAIAEAREAVEGWSAQRSAGRGARRRR